MNNRSWAFTAWITAVIVAGVAGCGDTSPSSGCSYGERQVCQCSTGAFGTRVCLYDRSDFGECNCPTAQPGPCDGRYCGLGSDGRSCGYCAPGQACSAGQCVMVTPPRDAGTPSGACTFCTSDAECPGSFCGQRPCDGLQACAPRDGSPCATISGVACPAVAVYHQCTDNAQCGALASCIPVWPGLSSPRFCSPMCVSNENCPRPVPGGVGIQYCVRNQCFLGCGGPAGAACTPTGLRCYPISSGVGYCAP